MRLQSNCIRSFRPSKSAWLKSRISSLPGPIPHCCCSASAKPGREILRFDYVEIKDTGVIIRGVVRGASEVATGDLSAYLELLKEDPVLGPKFEDPKPNIVTRTSSGRLRIEILLKFKAAKK